MVYFLQFEVNRVPTIGIPTGLGIVIMTGNSNVEVTRRLGRRKDREQNRDCPPI